MTWRVVVPLKPPGSRKTRLAGRLGPDARETLALTMLARVAETIGIVIAPTLLCAEIPEGWEGAWQIDRGEGLNRELARLRGNRGAFAVIHADLPLLSSGDVAALLTAGERGLAIGPDRHGIGTNSIAIGEGVPIDFTFGAGSFARFLAQRDDAVIVRRPGIALDIDTAADLDAALEHLHPDARTTSDAMALIGDE